MTFSIINNNVYMQYGMYRWLILDKPQAALEHDRGNKFGFVVKARYMNDHGFGGRYYGFHNVQLDIDKSAAKNISRLMQ